MNLVAGKSKRAFWARMSKADGRQFFWCNLENKLSRELCFTGLYEPQETAVIKALLRPGDTFADVGANMGYFTLLAAHRVGQNGRVLGLEPDPRVFEVLRRNVTQNQLDNVTVLQVAAADHTGTMELSGFDEAAGNFGISSLIADGDKGPKYEVQTRPLGELFGELGMDSVDVLKMDIEGAEGLALQGLSRQLSEHRVRRILLELHPAALERQGLAAQAVIRPLVDAGYRAWRIEHTAADTRRAAYTKHLSAESLLRPFSVDAPLDEWPHLIWVAPGLELFP